jgi:LDH2 family malate/lactate/ureidoglycolate dehydrogenase
LGTNPIAVAVPAAENPPFVADFATTAVAYGKMEILQRKGAPAPLGWVQDKDGNPTDDANAVKNGGALLPLGGDREHGSHKGYGLGAIVDIFSGYSLVQILVLGFHLLLQLDLCLQVNK